jgi:lipid A 3-O-deacylase
VLSGSRLLRLQFLWLKQCLCGSSQRGNVSRWLLVPGLIVGSTSAAAEDIVSQVSFGVLAHDVPILGPHKEGGADLNAELFFVSPVPDRWASGVTPRWRWIFRPHPSLGVEANTNGDTSQIYAALTWTVDLDLGGAWWPDHTVFLGVSLGPAYNTGHVRTRDPNRLNLGSNVLFRGAIEAGVRITPVLSLSAYFDHSSNAGLARQNEGLDNLGLRIGLHF